MIQFIKRKKKIEIGQDKQNVITVIQFIEKKFLNKDEKNYESYITRI